MFKKWTISFVARWALSTLGMWLSITFFGVVSGQPNPLVFILAGLFFSLVNSFVRPLATTLTLPLIIFTMGLFTLIINTAMVTLAIWLTPNVSMNFAGAILSSLVMSVVNGVVNFWITPYTSR